QTSCKNRILKELESSGIKLASVCSDPLGRSGRAMLEALLEGGRTPEQIADLARGALRKKLPELERAVTGSFSASTRFVLQYLLRRLRQIESDVAALDEQIDLLMKPYAKEMDLLLPIAGLDRVSIAAVIAEVGADMSLFRSADAISAW